MSWYYTYIASSRSRCMRSEWMDVDGSPLLNKKSSNRSALFLVFTKTMVREGGIESKRSHSLSRLSLSSTCSTYCIISNRKLNEKQKPSNALGYIHMRAARPSNTNTNMICGHVLLGYLPRFLWKRRGKHHVNMVSIAGYV